MSFPIEIIRSGVKTANSLTKGVQVEVMHHAFIGIDEQSEEAQYADPVPLTCVEDLTSKQLVRDGQIIHIGATLTFIGDVAPNGTILGEGVDPRREPFDTRDKIILSDGTTAPIISTPNSVTDPGTKRGIIHVVEMGARS